ncbi:ABC transporter permease [Candidatus Methylospira mobilis]|uniref:ABC transporter permease n=1 Tax=Candidatus Methylospira mobilis TaxID=1808979 RepID=A0A5Q0BKU0_9GAMM|nr:ABC transporter permease [Candidatus Methylospira mobilis]QFY42738.1 ABC transporter permease [Candidatus Methylospira mobilis]WNV04137.1 ABC transporter permease [Candidatus Methylospira mobilis]
MNAISIPRKFPVVLDGLIVLAAPVSLVLLWILLSSAEWIPEQLLVSPLKVIEALGELTESGELAEHLRKSLYRLTLGFFTGAGLGLIFGVLQGLFKTVEDYCAPLFNAVRQVPSIAFIPMLILIFGIEETFKIIIVAKAAFFPVALASYDSVKWLPKQYFEVAKIYQCPVWPLIRNIVIPATVPQILTGLRLSLSRSWMVLVAAELMAADSGIGQMMEWGRQMFRMDIVVVGVFITGLIGFSLDRGFQWVESRLVRWKKN